MNNPIILDEYKESVLNDIDRNGLYDDSWGKFQSPARLQKAFGNSQQLTDSLRELSLADYIEYVSRSLGDGAYLAGYKLKPLGANYLRKATAHILHQANLSNIANSNVVLGSSSVQQSTSPQAPLEVKWYAAAWFGWVMTIVTGLVVLLIGAFVFDIGK